ncbi:MAG: 50S ribosomal protein L9 [Desulfovibrionaceae bacterium]|jgi:large subunit ribosomal protein L9|nr:50S ribosomal protein L9 [Desulfovibrionaceae bacterium]
MKLILRSDVEHLGRLGDLVSVKPGYGRNYLIPQGLAMLATASNMKVFEQERRKLQAKMDELRAAAMTESEKIAAAQVVIEVRVGEGDKLYGSVTTAMIGDVLAEQGVDIDRRKIVLEQPIRALGEYAVPVKLHPDVQAELTVRIVRQGGPLEEEQAEEAEKQTEAQAPGTEAQDATSGQPESEQESAD